uniref:Caspase domain-containing protein n=1 Tax=Candidatus Kentrum sp. LPFa TaxID=2126335 RepID=A0A450WFG0_9GAMM|nr:MAG: Caspase domain-containing protein [Candidatus Kentron sp. LPFa]
MNIENMHIVHNRLISILLVVFSLLWMGAAQADANAGASRSGSPDPIYFYASQSGKKILDQGRDRGNPFVGALIELLARHELTFGEFSAQLIEGTMEKSRGFQRPDVSATNISDVLQLCALQLLPKPRSRRHVALVLAYSDYSSANLPSLPSAKVDMARIADAFRRAGFDAVRMVLDPGRGEIDGALKDFTALSRESDLAVIYATGHGIEAEGNIYLIPSSYPFLRKSILLDKRTLPLARLGATLQANRANFVFYAGGRDNPFAAAPKNRP